MINHIIQHTWCALLHFSLSIRKLIFGTDIYTYRTAYNCGSNINSGVQQSCTPRLI